MIFHSSKDFECPWCSSHMKDVDEWLNHCKQYHVGVDDEYGKVELCQEEALK